MHRRDLLLGSAGALCTAPLRAARVAAAPPVNAPPGHPELGIMTAARLRPPYTFAFPRRPSDLPSTTRWLDGFRPAGQEQVAAFRAAFAAWTAVSGGTLAFVELPPKQAAQAAVRVAETTDSMGLHADGITPFFGFTLPGRVVLCQAALALRGYAPGQRGFLVALHEIGHTLGFKHAHLAPVRVPPRLDAWTNTVMSYRTIPYGVTTGWPDGLPDGSYPGVLGYIDVAAVRAAYPATAT
jgi:hypothetical protein